MKSMKRTILFVFILCLIVPNLTACSSGYAQNQAVHVGTDGFIIQGGFFVNDDSIAVRPAMVIDFTA